MFTRMYRTSRVVDAPASELWNLLVDLDRWPEWGPSVRSAMLRDERLEHGATGTVTTVAGLTLPFEITAFEPGERWAWNVGGVPATDHTVTAITPNQCEVGFGVPIVAAPYVVVCQRALRRLDDIATRSGVPAA